MPTLVHSVRVALSIRGETGNALTGPLARRHPLPAVP
nr:MAG TPA: hypothetical protein [Caudoviricetes sp.]